MRMTASPTEKISLTQAEGIVTIHLDRPEVLNAIDREMLDGLASIVSRLGEEDTVRALILTGKGDRSFCVGADLNHIATFDPEDIRRWVIEGNRVLSRIAALPMPVIAAINGYALGGGLELAMVADLRLASENATFGLPEITHGWFPGWGGIHRLLNLIGEAKAKELIFLGERIDAETALQLHLVNCVVERGKLMAAAISLAQSLAQRSRVAIQAAKAALTRQPLPENGFEVAYESLALSTCFTTPEARASLRARRKS